VPVHRKAPHRPWLPDDEHAGLYQADQIPEPPTFGDDYRHRSAAAAQARMRVADDLGVEDLKAVVPPGLAGDTVVVYTSERMPLLDLAGVPADPRMQGRSLRPLLAGRTPPDWRRSMYYRYWEHDDPGDAAVRRQLTLELARVQAEVGDRPWRADVSIDL
jgi:Domain of unknown function (DUF4976)